ncbi:MAG: fructose-1,6-bisphosphatase [Muribaculaceae bacterium]|nr:fructose-1,6-bisphosphatase [Bacteroidales bacterium]MDY2733210.1 fructose-1,6-bisphosphatase [Muribaculaceae bacterium]MDY5387001.1 fructose-1,6-bisphosphatase [Muribaculaceae bacterium]
MTQKNTTSTFTPEQIERDRRVLELLSQNFGNINAASTEIINLEAILNLPKGTEHFVADLHGEDEAFRHILKNASGNIKRKVKEIYGNDMRDSDLAQFCSLIYYPEQKLELIRSEEDNLDDFYTTTLHRLVKVLQSVSSKYTRSKVRKALPKEYAYIIEELLHESPSGESKQLYYNRIVETIISTGQANDFIIAICNVIQRLSIDRLHILGDIYDRGEGAHIIMETLSKYVGFDIQWGNHDALWMGAAIGNDCCIANVLRNALRYANMDTLEEGYGINLVHLASFAMDTYGDDPCTVFRPKIEVIANKSEKSLALMSKMHKAISIIQFKLEGAMIRKHPEWRMEHRLLLDKMSPDFTTVTIDGNVYPMLDSHFPTIDPKDPYRLTEEEEELVEKLHRSFMISDKLHRHMKIMFNHGCMYNITNSNLMYHASVPLNKDGSLKEVELMGKKLKGKELLHSVGMLMRSAYNNDTPQEAKEYATDYYWYLWCGPESPLFDKAAMTTFERYFIEDKKTHHEEKGAYYKLREEEAVADMILDEFGVTGPHRHIINGHVPVKVGKGERPVKANGKMMVIDGGFAKAYHNTTGIAGYTLVYHSRGMVLVQHEPFSSVQEVVRLGTDIRSTTELVELAQNRLRVRDTDIGKELQAQIDELRELLYAYRNGLIKSK